MVCKHPKFLIGSLILIPSIVFLSLWFFKFEGNITGFFRIGSEFFYSPYLNLNDLFIFQDEVGHDGQQFLTIALDPWLNNQDSIAALDNPLYRYRRIFYPFLAYCLSLGQLKLIPYAMVLINVFTIVLLGYTSSQYFAVNNQSPWQSLFIFCIPSIWISLTLSTAELLSSFLFVLAVYTYQKSKFLLTAIALALSCLRRETMLLMWVSFLITAIWEKRQSLKILVLSLASLPCIGWGIYVSDRFAVESNSAISSNFTYPPLGILEKIRQIFTSGLGVKEIYETYSFSLLFITFILLITIIINSMSQNKLFFLTGILQVILFLCLKITVLGYYLDYNRVFMNLYLLLLLIPTSSVNQIQKFTRVSLFLGLLSASLAFLFLSS